MFLNSRPRDASRCNGCYCETNTCERILTITSRDKNSKQREGSCSHFKWFRGFLEASQQEEKKHQGGGEAYCWSAIFMVYLPDVKNAGCQLHRKYRSRCSGSFDWNINTLRDDGALGCKPWNRDIVKGVWEVFKLDWRLEAAEFTPSFIAWWVLVALLLSIWRD